MRSILAYVLLTTLVACGGGEGMGDDQPKAPCSDGVDNDGDGLTDFPDDLGCVSENDDTEDSPTSAQCMDGRDNDGDGLEDYPSDPGCFAPQADNEEDDCPDGPTCPQCADGQDNDDSGSMDYPNDPGCTSASDDLEFLSNPVACGAGLIIEQIPTTGMVSGMLDSSSTSMVTSTCGGGAGTFAVAYELHLETPRVVEITTDDSVTVADTVIDIRRVDCESADASVTCNDDIDSSNFRSKITESLGAGDYYIVISAHDTGSGGAFAMQIKTFAGEGTACTDGSECGPGLVCRSPLAGGGMVCLRPRCDDGVDDDADGKIDYPNDPGCTTPDDNDEVDDCPSGPNCPECGDGQDNDADAATDYPNDNTCLAAGDPSESCVSTDGVALVTTPTTMGDTATAVNDTMTTCGTTGTHTAPDRTYRLDVPSLTSLNIAVTSGFSDAYQLMDTSCIGAPIQCQTFNPIALTNVAAGTYYFIMDGYSTASGTFSFTVTGKISNGASCESALAQAGALTCGTGYACKGTVGSRTCQPALCSDNMDNDSDGKTDYPADPGCDSPADDTENDTCPGGAGCPVCGNGMDDDTDTLTDWPNDYGCSAASGTSEVFCMPEVDPTSLLTTTPVTGSTAGLANNFTSAMMCPTSSPGTNGPDKTYALSLPVTVANLVLDLSNSSFDTTLTFRDAQCSTQIACDDDSGDPGLQSKLTLTNVAPGNYAVVVDGYGSGTTGASGTYNLSVKGTVSAGTACTSPLFSGGAAAILACPTGTTCTGGVCQ